MKQTAGYCLRMIVKCVYKKEHKWVYFVGYIYMYRQTRELSCINGKSNLKQCTKKK